MVDRHEIVPILRTKLYRPPVARDVVVREELEARLETALRLPLTLVSAPAGYGKTTLASHYLENSETPSAWPSLDEVDGDLGRGRDQGSPG